ncbi:DUF4913 domain-containing protein [Spirillospora sp. NPDC048911]|uniref:DUF4913 domain-containing protein n=1 Tax=Spirillospora sp. NPDC048911 TaxID=3364527 RepID=UPI00371F777A
MSQPTSRHASKPTVTDDIDSIAAERPKADITSTSVSGSSVAVIGTSASRDEVQDAPEEAPDEPQPCFPSVEAWVTGHFVLMYRRTLGGEFRWCSQWWQHAEAISRLTALWYAWEAMRLQGATGIGLWHRDHLDHQLPILLGARGPFYQCTEHQHLEPHQAITQPAPPGWWSDGPHSDLANAPMDHNSGKPSQAAADHAACRPNPPAPTNTVQGSSDDQ